MRQTAKLPRKGFRKDAKQTAERQKKIAEFDQKQTVSWDEVDEIEDIERQYDYDLEEIYEEAEEGRRNYEYYKGQEEDNPSNRENRRLSLIKVFRLVELIGLKIADYPEYRMILDRWCQDRWQDKEAKENWTLFCKALSKTESGNRERYGGQEEAIIESCQKWGPICKAINTECKILWDCPKYCQSELYRKEKGGELTEKWCLYNSRRHKDRSVSSKAFAYSKQKYALFCDDSHGCS